MVGFGGFGAGIGVGETTGDASGVAAGEIGAVTGGGVEILGLNDADGDGIGTVVSMG